MKRILALLLALVFVVALCAGCGTKTEQPADPASPAETPTSESGGYSLPLCEETETFTVFIPDAPFLYTIVDNMDDLDKLCGSTITMEEMTNVHIDFTRASDAATQLPIVIASGEYPDMFWQCVRFYATGVTQLVDDGVVQPLTDYMDKLPHYQALLDGDEQLRRDATNISGDIVSLYTIKSDYEDQNQGLVVRKDWCDALGLTQEDFVTYDDFHSYLSAANAQFGGLYYPTSWVFGSSGAMASGYNINLDAGGTTYCLYHVGDEVRFGYTQPEAKELVTMMAEWYAEGLFVPEFIQASSDRQFDMAILIGQGAGYYIGAGQIEEYTSMADGGFELMAIRQPVSDPGMEKVKLFNLETRMADSLEVSTQVENMDLLLKWIDFGYTEYASDVWTYGTEGIHWDYNEDGVPKYHDIVINNPDIPEVMFAQGLYCSASAGPHIQNIDSALSTYSQARLDATAYWNKYSDFENGYNMPAKLTVLPEDSAEFANLWGEVQTLIAENVGQFVTGTKSLDEWDSFIAQLEQFGVDRIVEIWQKAYDKYLTF